MKMWDILHQSADKMTLVGQCCKIDDANLWSSVFLLQLALDLDRGVKKYQVPSTLYEKNGKPKKEYTIAS